MIINSVSADSKPEYYSISRLKTYKECSYKYFNQYIQKIKVASFSESTIMGNFIHSALEYLYTTEDEEIEYLIDALKVTSKQSLIDLRIVQEDEAQYLDELLWDYAEDITVLYDRASADYQGKDAIRKADGSVSTAPQMTSGWKKAEKELRLVERRNTIDLFVRDRNLDFDGMSMCFIFSEAYNISKKYRTPKQILEVIAVEMPLSHWDESTKQIINPVPMPQEHGGNDGVMLNGYIDAICKVVINGRQYTAIVDHKSSKAAYTDNQVMYNRQMMAYAYAYEYLTGTKIDAVGINNLRENTLALSLIDRDVMIASMNSLFSIHHKIKAEEFVKEIPEDSYSKCFNTFQKNCPYLETCYPKLAEKLNK